MIYKNMLNLKDRLIDTQNLITVVPVNGSVGGYSHHYIMVTYHNKVSSANPYGYRVDLKVSLRPTIPLMVECTTHHVRDDISNTMEEGFYQEIKSFYRINKEVDGNYFLALLYEWEDFLGETLYEGFFDRSNYFFSTSLL